MPIRLDIPGSERIDLDVLLVDVNGTLSDGGQLIDGVAERIARIREHLDVRLLSADTFGTMAETAEALGVRGVLAAGAGDKLKQIDGLGPSRCVAIGNGANDVEMLRVARLAIAILGPEGASGRAIAVADVVCRTITEALDLLLDGRLLVATLRS